MIDSGYTLKNGTKLFYEVLEDGFDIYRGDNSTTPFMHQPEPFIPNPSISYEENAKEMCKDMAESSQHEPEVPFTMTESMYTEMQSNIDYLMLLNDTTEE